MSSRSLDLSNAVNDFRKARRRADVRAILSLLSGGENRLLSYEEVRRQLRAVEGARRQLEDIPLSKIVGSVGRYQDFNREFLPLVNEDETRWVNVKLAMTGLEGVPPIEAYRIGDAYFVKDGNHRVSVARQIGAKSIQGYVTTVHSRVPLRSDADRDDLIIASEHADFLEQTQLDSLREGADLKVTAPGAYPELLEHISVHRYFMGIDLDRPVTWEEAVVHWYDAVYLPVVKAIREHRLLETFEGRTVTDLYLFLSEHRGRLERELGWAMDGPELAEGLAEGARGRRDLTEALHRARRTAAETGERLTLVDAVMLLFTGADTDADVLAHGLRIAAEEGAAAYALRVAPAAADAEGVQEQRELFEAAAVEAGVRGQFARSRDDLVKAVRVRAAYVDLVVAAVRHPSAPPRSPAVRPLLRRCPKPIWLARGGASLLAKPLVAFDGGAKSEEALFAVAYVCLRSSLTPVVISVDERARPAAETLEKAAAYLHGLGVEPILVEERGDVATAVLRTLGAYGCDLLAMGSRRYNPWLEDVTGGVLDEVLAHAGVPLLIT